MIQILKKELITSILVTLPIIYLLTIWTDLPDLIPMHYNMQWKADRWGSKSELILVTLFPFILHLILLIISRIRNKGTTEAYLLIKLVSFIIITITILAQLFTIINSGGEMIDFNFIAIGCILLIVSFFMRTIKPNNFIGIRVPWTLNNEIVWNKTHILASKVFSIAGLFIVISSLLVEKDQMAIVLPTIMALAVSLTLIYSYVLHRKYRA